MGRCFMIGPRGMGVCSWWTVLWACVIGGCLILGLGGVCHAQDLDKLQPKEMKKQESKPAEVPQSPEPQESEDKGETLLTKNLTGLVFLSSPDKVIKQGFAQSGIVVDGYQEQAFFQQMNTYLNKPLTLNGLNEILKKVVLYFRSTDRPVVDVYTPEQDISGGTIQIVVVEGRLGKVQVQGVRWFSEDLLADAIRMQPGDVIHTRPLIEDLNWINQNPFRSSEVVFVKGENPGETDVILKTQDRFPLRVFGGYEDTGTDLTGVARVFGGFNWGNVFGLDHLLNYQFTMSSRDYDYFNAHSLSYQAPLPWRHTLFVGGAYSVSKPDIDYFDLEGKSSEILVNYLVPLPNVQRKYVHSMQFGVNYKFSDNNLEFSTIPVFNKKTQIIQGVLTYKGQLPDQIGKTGFQGSLFYSPGKLAKYNKTSYFDDMVTGARAKYMYVKLGVDRLTYVAKGFDWNLKLALQASTRTLLNSEKLNLGGYNTVRGYDENYVSGDNGIQVINELYLPVIKFNELVQTKYPLGAMRFLIFLDYGRALAHSSQVDNASLASAGLGLRYQLSTHLSARIDYGRQLKHLVTEDDRTRLHVGLVGAF